MSLQYHSQTRRHNYDTYLTFHLNKAGTDLDVSGVTVMATVSVCDVAYCAVCFDDLRTSQHFVSHVGMISCLPWLISTKQRK